MWPYIHTDQGLSGIGEPFLENHADSVIAEAKRLEPVLSGQDPRCIEALWQRMYDAGLGDDGCVVVPPGPGLGVEIDPYLDAARATVVLSLPLR